MSDPSLVFIQRLTMAAPGNVIYHTTRGHRWDLTDCGRSISHRQDCDSAPAWINDMVPSRRDTADLIGRPCAQCRWDGR